MGGRSGAPGASVLHLSSFRNLRLQFDSRRQMSQLTVTHPRRSEIGTPHPFLFLCYCISGGLPRDLIRVCRNLIIDSSSGQTVIGRALLAIVGAIFWQNCTPMKSLRRTYRWSVMYQFPAGAPVTPQRGRPGETAF